MKDSVPLFNYIFPPVDILTPMISQSYHDQIEISYNNWYHSFSDKYETYYPAYPSKYNTKYKGTIRNPGAKKAVSLDNKNATSTLDIVGPPVNSITLGDVARKASNTSLHLFHHTPTFIIKSDIQDFDCQVLSIIST